jgi:hypothetical protein
MFRVVRHSPALFISTAVVLGAATFVAGPLLAQNLILAQNGEPAKPAEPGKTEPAKDAAGRPDESPEPARVLMGAAGRGECVWLGVRAVGLMAKDDLDTAFRHLELYDRFGCPGEHVQLSFRCVVRQGPPAGNIDPKEPKDQKAMAEFYSRVFDRAQSCWMNPALPALPNPPTASVEKPGAKN